MEPDRNDFVFFDLLKEQRQQFQRLTEVQIFYEEQTFEKKHDELQKLTNYNDKLTPSDKNSKNGRVFQKHGKLQLRAQIIQGFRFYYERKVPNPDGRGY